MRRINVALAGLGGHGADYLAAIKRDAHLALVAVADSQADHLRTDELDGHVARYEDYRSLIVESAETLDALLVALPPHQSKEVLELAAKHGLAVFHQAPFARTCEEAGHLVELFQSAGCPLVAARPWLSLPVMEPLADLESCIGRVFAADVLVRSTSGALGWRGDSIRAGGGVLLHDAYEPLDMLIHLLGFPEEVFGCSASALGLATARPYDTEDAAVVSLRFAHDRIATLCACRGQSANDYQVTLLGNAGTAIATPRALTRHRKGEQPQRTHARMRTRVAPAIGAFASALLDKDTKPESQASQHLPTMAVLDAAYLAAKTGAPETPRLAW